jgi:hypothetical protein
MKWVAGDIHYNGIEDDEEYRSHIQHMGDSYRMSEEFGTNLHSCHR